MAQASLDFIQSSGCWPCWRCCSSGRCTPTRWAAILKQRHKEESIKLRYGSLYTVIEHLLRRAVMVAAKDWRATASGPNARSMRSLRRACDELRDLDARADCASRSRNIRSSRRRFACCRCCRPMKRSPSSAAAFSDREKFDGARAANRASQSPEHPAAVSHRDRIPARAAQSGAAFRRRSDRPDRKRLGPARALARHSR